MQIQENPPIWCAKVLVTDSTGKHTVWRTGAIFQRPRDAKRAAMVAAVNLCGRRRFAQDTVVQPQVFQQRR